MAEPIRVLQFFVHGKCQPAGSKRFYGTGKAGVGRIADDNPKAAPWKAQVAERAARARDEAGWDLLRGPVRLTVVFYRARLAGHFTSKGALRAGAPAYPATKPDRGKLLRAIEDALEGVLYANDSQVVSGEVCKRWGSCDYAHIILAPLDEPSEPAAELKDSA